MERRHTVVYLRSYVPEFNEPENWPPDRPELNPVDYSVWGSLQQMVYRHKISHRAAETRANRLLGSAKPGHVKSSDRSLPKRLLMLVKVKGAHVEFRLD